jgi:hypothetical protein
VIHTAANVHDSKALEEAVDDVVPSMRKPGRGRPRKRPKNEEAPRRQRLRLPALAQSLEEEEHHPAHRPARHRV